MVPRGSLIWIDFNNRLSYLDTKNHIFEKDLMAWGNYNEVVKEVDKIIYAAMIIILYEYIHRYVERLMESELIISCRNWQKVLEKKVPKYT